jgi:hypothetical protein
VALTGLTTQGLNFFLPFQKFLYIRGFYWGRVAEPKNADSQGQGEMSTTFLGLVGTMLTWTVLETGRMQP